MTNEADIPGFPAGPTTPIGRIINPNGVPIAPKKAAGGLLKRIMTLAKPAPKVKPKAVRKARIGKPGRRGIEGDNKIHFGKRVRYY